MNKCILAALAIAPLLCHPVSVHAQESGGKFCKTLETRTSNTREDQGKVKLWEYGQSKLPNDPVIGYVDAACADRGEPRARLLDMGKRIWFSVNGPEGGPLDKGTLTVSDSTVISAQGDVGLLVKDLAIYGVTTPRHDCVYIVWEWQDHCTGH